MALTGVLYHYITDVHQQNNHWHCSLLPKLTTSDLCAIQKLALCQQMSSCGTISKRHKISFSDLYCSLLVEWSA